MAQFVLTCKMNDWNTQDGGIQTRSLVKRIMSTIFASIFMDTILSQKNVMCLFAQKFKQKNEDSNTSPETCWLSSAKVDSCISNVQTNSDKVVGRSNKRVPTNIFLTVILGVARTRLCVFQFSVGQRNVLLLLCGCGCGRVFWIAILISVFKL